MITHDVLVRIAIGLYERAMHHYARALELGTEAGDAYLQELVLNYAELATVEHGHPDDGLKMPQCARVKAWDIPRQCREVVIGEGSRVGRRGVRDRGLRDRPWPRSASGMAGERDGPQLAHQAISAVAQLTSVRVRRQLAPLAEALAARPGSDAAALAGMAHQVAATRT